MTPLMRLLERRETDSLIRICQKLREGDVVKFVSKLTHLDVEEEIRRRCVLRKTARNHRVVESPSGHAMSRKARFTNSATKPALMTQRVNINAMHRRHRALTTHVAGYYREAASVCLSRHHSSPEEIRLSDNGTESVAELEWDPPSPRVLAAWANDIVATEDGACCCVIAGVELLRGLFAVRRAETGTGADYYVGPKGSGRDDLENCLRLEVSGVNNGNDKDVIRRLEEKDQQARRGNSNLPALAGVVGFSAKLLMIRDVREKL
jgi:hypothetical protein